MTASVAGCLRSRRLQTHHYLIVCFFLVVNLIASLPATATEIQINQLYPGGTQVKSSEVGLAVTIPENWQGALPAGSSLFFIESELLQATIMLYSEQMSNQQLQQTMAGNIPLDAGINLIPKGSLDKDGELLIADYKVSTRPSVQARIYGRTGSNGLSVALITLTESQQPENIWNTAKNTALNLSFFEPTPTTAASAENGSWQDYMKGRYLARYYSGSNYHEKQELWLCSNGEFYTSGDSGGYGGAASGAFANRSAGTWQSQGDLSGEGVLVLQFGTGGEPSHYGLSLNNDKLYIDGTQWLRGSNEYCQ